MDFIENLQQKLNKLPKWLSKIILALLKFVTFILLWYILTKISIFFLYKPRHYPIHKETFNVCVLKDNKPNWSTLENSRNFPLCQKNYKNVQVGTYYWIDFEKIDNDNNEWQLTTWNDSMGDPFIYRYQINNKQINKVKPLWWSFGGMMIKVSYAFFALLLSAIVWDIVKKIIKKRFKS